MALPSIRELMGVAERRGTSTTDHDFGGETDDLADALREFHGHLTTGNYAGAATAMRSAHSIIASESGPGAQANSLYE